MQNNTYHNEQEKVESAALTAKRIPLYVVEIVIRDVSPVSEQCGEIVYRLKPVWKFVNFLAALLIAEKLRLLARELIEDHLVKHRQAS